MRPVVGIFPMYNINDPICMVETGAFRQTTVNIFDIKSTFCCVQYFTFYVCVSKNATSASPLHYLTN